MDKCIYIYIYVCVCVCVCVRAYVRVHACVYVCIFINHKGKDKRRELKNRTLIRVKMKQLLKLVQWM